jgi:hypothetical protein
MTLLSKKMAQRMMTMEMKKKKIVTMKVVDMQLIEAIDIFTIIII